MTAPILDLDLPPEHPLRQILDTISAHPEVREPLMRALLTEDFLALPAQVQDLSGRVDGLTDQVGELRSDFKDFREETREQFGAVNARVNETNVRIDETNVRIDETNTRIDETNTRIDETNTRIDETNTRIDETNTRIDQNTSVLTENTVSTKRMEGHVGRLRGHSYENLCANEIGVVLDGWIDRPVLANREQISSLLRHARWRNEISRDEYLDGLRPDVIAHETVGKSKPAHYAVVEASITFNRRDLENASRRAAVIAKVTGARTDAFVATHSGDWPQDIDHDAQSLGVTIIRHEAPEYSEA